MSTSEERKAAQEAALAEIKAAFREAARAEGFRIKGNHALRRRNGAQQSLTLYRSRFGPEWFVNVAARIDRSQDKGEEVLSRSDIETGLGAFARGDDSEPFRIAMKLTLPPPPQEGRGAVLKRILPLAMPWLNEVSRRETLERMTQDEAFRRSMRSMVRKPFYDDFGIPIRPPS